MNLLSTLKGIKEGITNLLIVKQEVEQIATTRLSICRGCSNNSEVAKQTGYTTIRPDEHCIDCTCNLAIKTRSMGYGCELGKWLAETDIDTGKKINEILEEKKEEEVK